MGGPVVSPLSLAGPAGSATRCRTHRQPLVRSTPPAPGEQEASALLAQEARERLAEAGWQGPEPAPRKRSRSSTTGYHCPECGREYAVAAAARLNGDDR